MVKPGDVVTIDFTTQNPSTGAAANATVGPVGTLVVNGADNGASVTVTPKATGIYTAAVTIPSGCVAGDEVQIRIAATVGGIAGVGVIWTDQVDTKRVADLNDIAAGAAMALTSTYDAAKTASQAGVAMTLTEAYEAAKTAAQPGDEMDLIAAPNEDAITVIQTGLATPGDIPAMITDQAVRDAMKLAPTALPAAADGSVDKHLDDAQADLDSPDQYKANVSALALEATLTAIKGTGWTTETLKSIGGAIAALPTVAAIAVAVWTYTSRSLSQTLASIVAALTGSTITMHRGDTFSQTFTLGVDISTRSKLWFTAMDDRDDDDSQAIIQVEESAGLLYVEKAPAVSAAYGSLTVVTEASGVVTVMVVSQATALLGARMRRWYDFQMLTESGTIETIKEGRFTVERDVTKTIA